MLYYIFHFSNYSCQQKNNMNDITPTIYWWIKCKRGKRYYKHTSRFHWKKQLPVPVGVREWEVNLSAWCTDHLKTRQSRLDHSDEPTNEIVDSPYSLEYFWRSLISSRSVRTIFQLLGAKLRDRSQAAKNCTAIVCARLVVVLKSNIFV